MKILKGAFRPKSMRNKIEENKLLKLNIFSLPFNKSKVK